jgi:hypothetical protein
LYNKHNAAVSAQQQCRFVFPTPGISWVEKPISWQAPTMANAQMGGFLRHLRRLVGARLDETESDSSLLQRFALQRDEACFATLVERHGKSVLSVCLRILGNEHDAADAFQATFLVLARRAGSVCWQKSVANWLYGVARRIATKARASLVGDCG